MRNSPPSRPDQKVYVSVRSKVKSMACSRPVAPATCSTGSSDMSSGRPATRAATAAVTPTMITTICLTSAQVTACTPPSIV